MAKHYEVEKILWSIAFPGFAQLLNGHIVKGIVFIFLEFLINVKSQMNQAILESFNGNIETAIHLTDYQWLLFYPCVYMFAIFDGYREAGGGQKPLSFIPFVFSAYFGTIGVIYSPTLKVFGWLLGPIWLSIVFLFIGFGVGIPVRMVLSKIKSL